MKKILLYLLAFIAICFVIPAIFTKKVSSTFALDDNKSKISDINKTTNTNKSNSEIINNNVNYDYNKYGRIKLLHVQANNVEELNIDDYLYNVVSAEMPANYETEALKAQAVVARTYTIYKANIKKHEQANADVCDSSSCCQAWISKEDRLAKWNEAERESNWQKIVDCVNSTKGQVITYNNQIINALFHSNSGGTTEVPTNVWAGSGQYPYLQSVQTSGEDGYSQYASEVNLSQNELLTKLQDKYPDIQIDFSNNESIKILEYTDSNRVRTIKFGNHEISGVEARTLLGLKSTNFEVTKENDNIKFNVKGYGHGVGMSQTGADTLAKQGSNYQDIIHHFYTDVEIKDINSI